MGHDINKISLIGPPFTQEGRHEGRLCGELIPPAPGNAVGAAAFVKIGLHKLSLGEGTHHADIDFNRVQSVRMLVCIPVGLLGHEPSVKKRGPGVVQRLGCGIGDDLGGIDTLAEKQTDIPFVIDRIEAGKEVANRLAEGFRQGIAEAELDAVGVVAVALAEPFVVLDE